MELVSRGHGRAYDPGDPGSPGSARTVSYCGDRGNPLSEYSYMIVFLDPNADQGPPSTTGVPI